MTVRKNGIVIDEDGPWTAACFLRTDTALAGIQHGVHGNGTLCGLAGGAIEIVRNPFFGLRRNDCADCARRLRELAS